VTHHRQHPIQPHHRTHTYPAYIIDFIKTLVPIAKETKKRWGTPIAVLVAQGALESSWGQHVKGNAYFGIKGRASSGRSISFATHEVVAGRVTTVSDSFRAYASLADAADDYGRFLRTSKRYASCFAFSSQPEQFADRLAEAGYATDPDYAPKLKSIMRAHNLARYDQIE
jgi:flagellar protein FlgJ